uniref:Uncharacterized protein n=1 Tax=Oryza punctata TaxID=4537 RepID=A0A0E0KQB2_ORYPU
MTRRRLGTARRRRRRGTGCWGDAALLPPAGPTPGGSLPLSSIDKTTAVHAEASYTACIGSVLTANGTVEIEGERLLFFPPTSSPLPPPLAPPRPCRSPPLP